MSPSCRSELARTKKPERVGSAPIILLARMYSSSSAPQEVGHDDPESSNQSSETGSVSETTGSSSVSSSEVSDSRASDSTGVVDDDVNNQWGQEGEVPEGRNPG